MTSRARRRFLKQAGLTGAGLWLGPGAGAQPATAGARVFLLLEPNDAIASARPCRWALDHLRQTLDARQVALHDIRRIGDADPGGLVLVVAGKDAALARKVGLANAREAFALERGRLDERNVVYARGADVRGLVYALTELADRAALADDPLASLAPAEPVSEKPANLIRGCMRMFCSDVEDKPWFYDRDFWRSYLTLLVSQRFNQFNLAFGIGYDFTREIRDAYLHFAYPFLIRLPEYRVSVTGVGAAERDKNLDTLRFISDEARLRGLHFQLGLWTHAYEWSDSPDATSRVEGLTPDNHASYCRDALAAILKECPGIGGVTLRTHGESGVSEGSYDFWRAVFDGVSLSGRRVEIDLHAKGLDKRTIDLALATGLPVVVSPKFWAEHMGLPYHQAWIRPTELPQREKGEGLFAQSSGARSFLRYGYGDLLTEDRRYGVLHRVWPGTQRLLLSGDPLLIAAYGRASSFCDGLGCEIMEPLSFKGRKGSGQKGPRTGYADASLTTRYDFEKYLYLYRLWGRLLYDPETPPDAWRPYLRRRHGAAADAMEAALGASSRILPLLTTAHSPSAANNHWWPEMPVHLSIVDDAHPEPFTDTPKPKRFGAVSPLDPQLFARVDDFADDLLKGRRGERYSPAEVAASFDAMADQATASLAAAREKADAAAPGFRRFAIDVLVGVELARFFAEKFRAACLYSLFEKTGDVRLQAQAIERYRSARQAWQRIVAATQGVYMDDVSYGIAWYQRGHWADRAAALDKDIQAMERATTAARKDVDSARLVHQVVSPATRPRVQLEHKPPPPFPRGRALPIEAKPAAPVASLSLLFRHTNQAESWQTTPMLSAAGSYRAEIPADYTDSPFPLQYYFVVAPGGNADELLYPGFDETWTNQPYFVVRQAPPPKDPKKKT
jgi:hypothetical protein